MRTLLYRIEIDTNGCDAVKETSDMCERRVHLVVEGQSLVWESFPVPDSGSACKLIS